MKGDYRSLDYYKNLCSSLEKKKDFRKAYLNHVNNIRKGSNCLFGCSFLCCCCCCKMGVHALTMSDFSRYWANSIEKAYEKENEKRILAIFKDALIILEKTRKYVYDKTNPSKNYTEWMNSHDIALYNICDIYGDMWLHKIFRSIYNIAKLPINMDYQLSSHDIDKLFIAMPLFYPVIFSSEKLSFSMNSLVIEEIGKLLASAPQKKT